MPSVYSHVCHAELNGEFTLISGNKFQLRLLKGSGGDAR
jgi:hypothetical protein